MNGILTHTQLARGHNLTQQGKPQEPGKEDGTRDDSGTLPIENPDDQGTQPEEDEPRDDAQLKKGDDQAQREPQSTADSGKD